MKKLIAWIVIILCALVVWLVKISLSVLIVIWVSQYTHPEWNGCYPLGKSLYKTIYFLLRKFHITKIV